MTELEPDDGVLERLLIKQGQSNVVADTRKRHRLLAVFNRPVHPFCFSTGLGCQRVGHDVHSNVHNTHLQILKSYNNNKNIEIILEMDVIYLKL